MNQEEIKASIKNLLKNLGENPEREGLVDTPRRVSEAYKKLFGGYEKEPKDLVTVFDGENYDEMIICKNIDFFSTCEHHMLPFYGQISIGYIPNKKIIGLSKLPRIVEIYSRRLQNQERLTMQVAEALKNLLDPKGVGVVAKAKHLCLMARGVEKQNTDMITSSCNGLFKSDPRTRSEFLKLIG